LYLRKHANDGRQKMPDERLKKNAGQRRKRHGLRLSDETMLPKPSYGNGDLLKRKLEKWPLRYDNLRLWGTNMGADRERPRDEGR